jgi:sortase (surface protein transpeptidase)
MNRTKNLIILGSLGLIFLFLGTDGFTPSGTVAPQPLVVAALSRPFSAIPSIAPSLLSVFPVVSPTSDPSPTSTPGPTSSPTPTLTLALTPTPTSTPSLISTPNPTPTPMITAPVVQPTPKVKKVTLRPYSLYIPALGINEPIINYGTKTATGYECGDGIPNKVIDWLCLDQNDNFYLLGHAYGVFKPLRTAYLNDNLPVGLEAYYTDAQGVTHRYVLAWVKHLTVAVFAQGDSWAATPGPVLTLQTCDGAQDQYRIIVRFVPAD